MQKQRLDLEYPLSARKPDILWNLISTDHGLERWLADRVTEEDDVLSLTWGDIYAEHHTLRARIVERVKPSHVKLRWVDEDDPDAYWEMRIGRSELTEQICLCVVDYAPEEEVDVVQGLWDDNLERLHQSSGL
ncbi:MAG: hypothetical protein J6M25_06155 [Prevotella sp.]|nr:hypothetical protein [Prevotella sp.]